MRSSRDIDKRIRQLHMGASAELDRRVHADIDAALADKQQDTTSVIRRTTMLNPIMKLAVAAAVVLAGLLGLNVIEWPHAAGVAWARIPECLKAIDTFMFRLSIQVSEEGSASAAHEPTGQWTFYLSEQYGFRMDITGNGTTVSWYVPPVEDTLTMVIPSEKKWSQTPLPPEQRGKMPEEYEDPAEYITRFLAHGYKELGRSVIDGVEVEGIEVANPPTKGGNLESGIGRMWVDVQTELPIRIEIEGAAGGKAIRWLIEFKWSEAIDPAVFDPNIPSDYTPLVG